MRPGIFFPVLIAVMAGCGLGSHFFAHLFPYINYLLVAVAMLVCIFAITIVVRKANSWFGITIIILLLFVGLLVYGMRFGMRARDQLLVRYVNETVTMVGTVASDPETNGTRQRFTFAMNQLADDGERHRIDDKATVSLPRYPIIAYGDTLSITATLELPETFDTEYGRTFPYDEYLRSQGIGYTLFAEESETLAHNQSSKIITMLLNAKHSLFSSLDTTMHEPFGSIARAMVFGDKSGIPDKLTNQFQTTGLIHIMVLSGYNITIIAVALLAVTQRMGKNIGIVISSIAILAFLLMTGLTPTSMRAGIMGAIGLLALVTYRKSNPLRALFLAGAVMAIINPFVVLQSVSFQLSFIATLGLITLTPLFTFVRIPEKFGLREIIASTIATQFAVLPLIIGKIGMVSITGLLVNIIVVPLVPFIMLLTAIAATVGLLLPFPIVGILPEVLVRGVVWIVETAAHIDVVSFAHLNAGSGFWIGLAISGAVILLLYFLRKRSLVY